MNSAWPIENDSPTIEPCPAQQKTKMALSQRSACAAACPLSGAKSGRKTGARLNTALIAAERINEADYLYPL